MNARELFQEFRFAQSGDWWGDTLGLHFDVAGELFNRGAHVPDSWEYRPGAGRPVEVSDYWAPILAECSEDTLRRAGNALRRYTEVLRRAGCDY